MSEPTDDDATAPVWADPTTPIPPAPPVPPTPQDTPVPTAPPTSNPFAQQPAAPPSGQQLPSQPYAQPELIQQYPEYSQQQGYGQPQGYGPQYPAYGQSPYGAGTPPPSNTSAIVLTIVAGLSTLTTCFVGIPSLIFGIMALTSNSADPPGSRKKARIGWIIYGINWAVLVLAVAAIFAIIAIASNGTVNSNTTF